MIPIYIRNLLAGKTAPVDIHVKLADDHFVKVAKKGESFEIDRLSNYENRKIEFFYIKNEDFGDLSAATVTLIRPIIQSRKLDSVHKGKFLTMAIGTVVQEFQNLPFDEQLFQHTLEVSNSMASYIAEKPSLTKVLEEISNLNSDILKHSTAMSLIAPMLAELMGWKNQKRLAQVAMAGLLADIGMKELPPALSFKSRHEMNKEDLEQFESHPFKSAQILNSVPNVPGEVTAMVLDHHEHPGGLGFPRKLKKDRIFPMARVITLADLLAEQVVRTAKNPSPRTLQDAITYVSMTFGKDFHHTQVEALDKLKVQEENHMRAI